MRVFSILAVCGFAAWPGLSAAPGGAYGTGSRLEPIVRTVYVTVTDGQGSAVPDLGPDDFTLKEGGKQREVIKAHPATARIRLTVMAEERLLGDGSVRLGLF